jgi:hypothetical protein
MKKFTVTMTILVICILVMGCATIKSPSGFHYTESIGTIRAEETNQVWFGIFGSEYAFPPIEAVTRAHGITRITSIEHFVTPGLLFLWMTYHTVVTGT